MISRDELSHAKESRKTNLYNEEKEYLQYIFLNAISKYNEGFVFKGGTALRICYGLERASEDLDFSTAYRIDKIKEIVKKCLKDFDLLNIPYEIYSEKEYKGNIRIEIRFKGPLYNGNLHSTNTLKIDFNKNISLNKVVKVVQKLFSDVPLFTIFVLDEKEILIEKLRALINRIEARDLYDIWILFSKGVEIDIKLLKLKFKEEKIKIYGLRNLKLPSKEEFEIQLKNIVFNLPPYSQVKKEVMDKIDDLKNKLKIR